MITTSLFILATITITDIKIHAKSLLNISKIIPPILLKVTALHKQNSNIFFVSLVKQTAN